MKKRMLLTVNEEDMELIKQTAIKDKRRIGDCCAIAVAEYSKNKGFTNES